MRKFITSFLAIAMILSSFSMVAFAADTDVYFNDGSTTFNATEDTFTLEMYMDYDGDDILEYGWDTMSANYSITGATVVGTANVGSATHFGFGYTATETALTLSGAQMFTAATGAAKLQKIATYVFTRANDAEKAEMNISSLLVQDTASPFDYTISYPTKITINWPSAGDPKPELKDTYKLGNITYTNVPNITVTKNLASASISGDLLIDYLKEEVAYNTSKAFEVVLGAFSGAGDVTFDVALINVPSYVTVTGMDIALD